MDFLKLVTERVSVRSYDPDKPVAREVLMRILEAGRMAPSASNRQPWQFIVASRGEMLEKIHTAYDKPWFHDAPHVLIVKGDRERAWQRAYDDYNSLETDLTIAMDHMILAAAAEGVGTCWIAAFKPDALAAALGLGESERVFAITPLGYPRGDFKPRPKNRKPIEEVVTFI